MSEELQVIAVILILSQLAQAFLTFRSARKEVNRPIEELKKVDMQHTEAIGQIKRDIENIKDDLDHAFDKERELEKNNLVLQRGVLALIYHELDGNHTQVLEEAKTELEKVVWHKSK